MQAQRRAAAAALLLFSAFAVSQAAQTGLSGAAQTGTVQLQQGGGRTLLQALRDPATHTIVLESNYSVADELATPLSSPISLDRNLTIRGRPGADPPVTLDLAFKRAVLVLCSTCRVTLRDLTLANARRGTGAAIDFVVGDDDMAATSAVLLQGVHRMRVACTPGMDAAEVLTNTPRSQDLPPSPSGKQMFHVRTVTVEGVTYTNALHLQDFSQDLPLMHLEGRGHTAAAHYGGYALGSKDVLYLCQHDVSEACLAEKPPDVCVNEIIDSVLNAHKQQPPGLSGMLVAAIVVPIVLVGALIAAMAAWALVRRRRKRQQQALPLALKPGDSASSGTLHIKVPDYGGGYSGSLAEMGSGVDSAMEVHAKSSRSQARSSLELARQPQGTAGWQLVNSHISPSFEGTISEAAASNVEFGAFVGAGSFGRVYRARWAGRDVACKVIEHDRTTLAVVDAEASLMLSLSHANVVRAYYYCTFVAPEPAKSERSARATGRPSFSQLRHQASGSVHAQQDSQSLARQPSSSAAAGSASGSSNGGGSGAAAALLQQQRQEHRRQQQQPDQGRPPQAPQQQQQRQDAKWRQDQDRSRHSCDVLVRGLSLDTTDSGCDQEAAAGGGSSRDARGAPPGAPGPRGSSGAPLPPLPAAGAAYDSAGKTSDSGSGAAARRSVGFAVDDQPSGSFTSATGSNKASGKVKAETWLVQEFCDQGTLGYVASAWEAQHEGDEQMLERLLLLRDTAEGLAVLHANNVVHGDLNCRNVLVATCAESKLGMCAKVADLGLSRCLQHQATHRTTNTCGTLSHMAPELLRYGRMSTAVDVYAFGIMMWELYHAARPAFDKLHYGQFFETVVLRNVRPCVPAGLPPDYELLMRQCWTAEPGERPSVPKLLQCLDVMIAEREKAIGIRRASADSGSAAAAALATAAASAPLPEPVFNNRALDALVALLQPQEAQVQAILQQQEEHKQRQQQGQQQQPGQPGEEAKDPSSTRLSVISMSRLFAPGTAPDAAASGGGGADAGAPGVIVIGDDQAQARDAAGPAQQQAQQQRQGAAAAGGGAAGAPARRGPPGAAAGYISMSRTGSLARADGEGGVLDTEPSAHGGNRLWFV